MAETSIVYDYEIQQIRIHTDRPAVARQIVKRSGSHAIMTESKSGDRVVSWAIELPMAICRGAHAITKVLGTV